MDRARTERELLADARTLVAREGSASPSMLSRELSVSWKRAARLVEQSEADGLVSQPDRQGRRSVRGADGTLEQPRGKPWRPWEEVVSGWLERFIRWRKGGHG